MSIEQTMAKVFQMSDAVWERHANPWSVWTRFLCLPLLVFAVWSRIWIGWLSVVPIALVFLWIWLNPRVFRRPASTAHWASKAVLGERVLLRHPKCELPRHHVRAIRNLQLVTFAGFLIALYGLLYSDAKLAIFGTLGTMLGKTWFLDRMVWLYQDLSPGNDEYLEWLY